MFTADAGAQHIEQTRHADRQRQQQQQQAKQQAEHDGVLQHVQLHHGFDGVRSAVMTSWNSLVFAPAFFFWFRRLERAFPGNSRRAVLQKVITNQVAMNAPITALALAYAVTTEAALRATQGQREWNAAEVREEVERRWSLSLGVALLASAAVWVPVNLLNFSFVPPHMRVLPTIVTSCVWNTYLSLKAHEPGLDA